MGRCLSQVMKLSLLVTATIVSVGWALSESRPARHTAVVRAVETTPEPELPRQARQAPPLPARPLPPLPPPLPPAPKREPLPMVAKISGRIVDLDGNPRSDVKADLDLGDICMWIYTDGDGRFSASVAPGDYTVSAVGDNDTASAAIPVSLRAGEEVHDLILELARPQPELDVE